MSASGSFDVFAEALDLGEAYCRYENIILILEFRMSDLSRRQILAGLAGAAGVAAGRPAEASTYVYNNLGLLAKNANILFGAALGSPYYSDPTYAALFAQTRLLISEWQFNLGSLMPTTRGVFDFYNADRIVALGQSLGKPVKAHCLFWQAYNPAWLASLSTSELQYFFDSYIDAVVPRYAGKIYAWNIANEPFWPADGLPGGYGNGPWYQAFGAQWPTRAFKRVAALDPKAKFCVNEAQCDNNVVGLGATIRPALLTLVDAMQQAGATVSAVGLESHLDMGMAYDDSIFQTFVGQLAQRNVEIWISELDVREFTLPASASQRDSLVAARVSSFLSKALTSPAVTQVATWGLADKYTWLDAVWAAEFGATSRRPRPLPYDTRFQPKPMWTAMANAFHSRKIV
jgi:endo-1,4-beta-xylanase